MKKLLSIFTIISIMTFGHTAFAANISGTVLDEKGVPLEFANVYIDGTSDGGYTDDSGKFSFDNTSGKTQVTISYLGYETQHVTAGENLNVKMKPNTQTLDEVTVTGKRSKNGQPCDKKNLPANAASGIYKFNDSSTEDNIKFDCIIDKCESNYTLSDDKLSCIPNKENTETKTEKKKEEPKPDPYDGLTDKQRADRQRKLDDNARAMKEKETSLANRTLTAAAIGASSMGLNQMLAAGAEQKADERAEADMKALLASFYCTYGQNQQVAGGETEIYLPGANELTVAVQDYKKLALEIADVKEQLDMMPGVESTVVIDKATSGLYDDESIGRRGGAFTSLSRALSNPEGEDAAAWAKQKSDTSSKKKTGLILTGVGVIGGIAGDMLINSGGKDGKNIFGQDVAKESSRAINDEYRDLARRSAQLKQKIEALPVKSTDKTSEELEQLGIDPNTVEQTEPTVAEKGVAETQEEIEKTVAEATAENPNVAATLNKKFCEALTCTSDGKVILEGVNFDTNKSIIRPGGITKLQQVAQSIQKIQSDSETAHLKFMVMVHGYTDSTGSVALNEKLSQARAESVRTQLTTNGISANIIIANGMGISNTYDNKTSAGRAKNRRVEIHLIPEPEQANTGNQNIASLSSSVNQILNPSDSSKKKSSSVDGNDVGYQVYLLTLPAGSSDTGTNRKNSVNIAKATELIKQNPGIDLNFTGRGFTDGTNTPLINAVLNSDPELVQLMLNNGANVNMARSDGTTPIISAVYYGCVECAKILMKHGANPKIKDDYNHDACQHINRTDDKSIRPELKTITGC
ncbi:carboxypeptidase-like regulatory domain-containing protein [Lachnospiraceae bacterium OttesenSCG-928-E19]|nr:carboxypeptidase-like regulatory domain-containing protein [Lachnospiraceae bacterium OttesenSCG-928-E19]